MIPTVNKDVEEYRCEVERHLNLDPHEEILRSQRQKSITSN